MNPESYAWQTEYLDELCEIIIGHTPSRKNPEFWGNGYPWVTIQDITEKEVIDCTREEITEAAIKTCNCKRIEAGTLLMSFKLSVGKLAFAARSLFTNEAIAALRISNPEKLDKKYLFYALQTVDYDNSTDRAAKGKTLNKSKLKKLLIPIPPLPEQKRIAAILDKADDIRRKRSESLRLADEFLKSGFLDMFGDPVRNLRGWDSCKLGEHGQVITGNSPPRKRPENYGDFIEWIKSDNINSPNAILSTAEEGLSEQGLKIGRWVPSGSTLVTCIAGSHDCIGNCAYADRPVAFNQQINAIVPTEETDPYFLYFLVLLSKRAIQAASTSAMKGMVNKTRFSNVESIAPPSELQERFGQVARNHLHSLNKYRSASQETDKLYHSLVQRAFRGEL